MLRRALPRRGAHAMHHRRHTALLASLLLVSTAAAQEPWPERFERDVRPLLAARCFECHGPTKQKSGLRVDHGTFLRAGGARGPAIVPGSPDQSLMIQAVRCEHPDLAMPPKRRLTDAERSVLEEWVAAGAYWPDEPTPGSGGDAAPPFDLEGRLAAHWCWRAPRDVRPPEVTDPRFAGSPIDRFVFDGLRRAGLTPNPPASREAWLRRVTFDLTGLPPTIEALDAFVADTRSDAVARAAVVDGLLGTNAFGERFARHWLDLVRYAETMGHEFDFPMANPWRYRDYLIRAFRDDVAYDQLIHEHIAGDLLPEPRRDPETDLPESPIGTAAFWFMDQTHSPVESRQALSDRIDNAIDVTSKAFLGVTVACARCHDHKFDAISTRDYYALFGVLESSRYTLYSLEGRELPRLAEAAHAARARAADALFAAADPEALAALVAATIAAPAPTPPAADDAAKAAAEQERAARIASVAAEHGVEPGLLTRFAAAAHGDAATLDPGHPLHPLRAMAQGQDLGTAWTSPRPGAARPEDEVLFDPATDRPDEPGATWFTQGSAFAVRTDVPTVRPDPSSPRVGILPGTLAHSGAASPRLAGTLHTRDFEIERRYLHVLAAGDEGRINVVVDGFNLIRDPIYGPLKQLVNHTDLRWHTFDLGMWRGHRAYLQAVDAPSHDPADPSRGGGYKEDAWLAVGRAVLSAERSPPAPPNAEPPIRWLGKLPPSSPRELGARYATALRAALGDLRSSRAARPGGLALVGWLGEHGLLPGITKGTAAQELAAYAAADAALPAPAVLGAMTDGPGLTPRVHIRGSHRTLGDPVARRFLTALDEREFDTAGSGRLELARRIASPENPLTARVLVNRLWHHLFGRGLVPTVDNFGVLGEEPTHPELLDWLARRFVEDGWSIQKSIRRMVLSETYALSSQGTDAEATVADPENERLHSARIRRLQGEAIRDALLVLAGRLDATPFGPPVPVHLTPFMDGRGRPGRSGPLDGNGRRSIYLEVRRNFLEPMFLAFDTPMPFSTVGARSRSNVPAQALTMMNSPLVHELTRAWSKRVLEIPGLDDAARVRRMYREAYARLPGPDEEIAALAFVAGGGPDEWAALAHVLVNVKEFVFIP